MVKRVVKQAQTIGVPPTKGGKNVKPKSVPGFISAKKTKKK